MMFGLTSNIIHNFQASCGQPVQNKFIWLATHNLVKASMYVENNFDLFVLA